MQSVGYRVALTPGPLWVFGENLKQLFGNSLVYRYLEKKIVPEGGVVFE